jgi:hypothetical protein
MGRHVATIYHPLTISSLDVLTVMLYVLPVAMDLGIWIMCIPISVTSAQLRVRIDCHCKRNVVNVTRCLLDQTFAFQLYTYYFLSGSRLDISGHHDHIRCMHTTGFCVVDMSSLFVISEDLFGLNSNCVVQAAFGWAFLNLFWCNKPGMTMQGFRNATHKSHTENFQRPFMHPTCENGYFCTSPSVVSPSYYGFAEHGTIGFMRGGLAMITLNVLEPDVLMQRVRDRLLLWMLSELDHAVILYLLMLFGRCVYKVVLPIKHSISHQHIVLFSEHFHSPSFEKKVQVHHRRGSRTLIRSQSMYNLGKYDNSMSAPGNNSNNISLFLGLTQCFSTGTASRELLRMFVVPILKGGTALKHSGGQGYRGGNASEASSKIREDIWKKLLPDDSTQAAFDFHVARRDESKIAIATLQLEVTLYKTAIADLPPRSLERSGLIASKKEVENKLKSAQCEHAESVNFLKEDIRTSPPLARGFLRVVKTLLDVELATRPIDNASYLVVKPAKQSTDCFYSCFP